MSLKAYTKNELERPGPPYMAALTYAMIVQQRSQSTAARPNLWMPSMHRLLLIPISYVLLSVLRPFDEPRDLACPKFPSMLPPLSSKKIQQKREHRPVHQDLKAAQQRVSQRM